MAKPDILVLLKKTITYRDSHKSATPKLVRSIEWLRKQVTFIIYYLLHYLLP